MTFLTLMLVLTLNLMIIGQETQHFLSDTEMIKLLESDVGEDPDFDGF